MIDYERDRFGSAGPAELQSLHNAGVTNGQGISLGFDPSGRYELGLPGDNSALICAGAGSGKSASILANNLIAGRMPHNFVCFSPRRELEPVSMLALSLQGYEIRCIDRTQLFAHIARDRTNPLDHLRIDCPNLIANAQKTALDIAASPQGARTVWTYDEARPNIADFLLASAEKNGVASWPDLYRRVMSVQGNLDEWCSYLSDMENSRFPSVRNCAGTLMALQQEGRESFSGPMGVMKTAVDFMRDPTLQSMLGGDDFSLDELLDPNNKIGVFVSWPSDLIGVHASAIRQIIGSVIQRKLANPNSAKVSVIIDEMGLLRNFSSVRDLMIFGRGAGLINNILCYQEISQLYEGFGQQADEILGCCAAQVFKAVRTQQSASLVSRKSGTMTLEYNPVVDQSNALRMKRQAAMQVLQGGSLLEARAEIEHYNRAQQHKQKQARQVLTEDEVMNMPPDTAVMFLSGLVEGPVFARWINHFDRRDFAGKYLNNPWHGDQVRIKTRFGSKMLPIIEERVPDQLAHLPQYRSGVWHYVSGHRPNV